MSWWERLLHASSLLDDRCGVAFSAPHLFCFAGFPGHWEVLPYISPQQEDRYMMSNMAVLKNFGGELYCINPLFIVEQLSIIMPYVSSRMQ